MSAVKKAKLSINLNDDPIVADGMKYSEAYPKGPQLAESTIQLLEANPGLTFDELTLSDRPVEHTPNECNTASFITRRIQVKTLGILSAAMDTVTEKKMALAMAQSGGVGIIHCNMTAEEQAEQVKWVRTSINSGGMIDQPVTFLNTHYLSDLQAGGHNFSNFPIVDQDGKLLGMVSRDSLDFIMDDNPRLVEVMTPVSKLTTAVSPVTTEKAFIIMKKEKIKHLAVLDNSGVMVGLYVWRDVKASCAKKQLFGIDNDGHFIVGASIGTDAPGERIRLLRAAGCKLLVVESSHGSSAAVRAQVAKVREVCGDDVQIIAGNVASYQSAKYLLEADSKPDAIKVGIGAGSAGVTRQTTGTGVPQVSAIYQVWKAVKDYGDATGYYVPIVADGGIRSSGDVVKAFAVGASSVMLGSMLGGCEESPGLEVSKGGRRFKTIRGSWGVKKGTDRMGTKAAMGVQGLVAYKGPCNDVVNGLRGGVQSGLCHSGATTVPDFQMKANIWLQSSAGMAEGRPHDITDVHG